MVVELFVTGDREFQSADTMKILFCAPNFHSLPLSTPKIVANNTPVNDSEGTDRIDKESGEVSDGLPLRLNKRRVSIEDDVTQTVGEQ